MPSATIPDTVPAVPPRMLGDPVARGALPEVPEPRCPYCRGDRTVAAGRVTAVHWTIKEERRCEGCQTAFLVVRVAVA
jgi:hypothetical protein